MTPDYYSDLYKRFGTYVRDYSGNEIFRVASGFDTDRYGWTDTVMEHAGHMLEGISLHYYTIAGEGWSNKGPSVNFGEDLYFSGLQKALLLDEYIQGHKNRMDKYDPEKRVALIVDEWGVWTDPLPGTTPGFLQQQNSLRDALIASISLDILNKHSDRVRMANIAQMVNVLQAVILTEGEKMVKTPTYHVFDLYRAHFDATLLHTNGSIDNYEFQNEGIPAISWTASKSNNGRINLTITNIDSEQPQPVVIDIRGQEKLTASYGKILTAGKVNAINTFDNPNKISLENFEAYELAGNKLTLTLPSKSVVLVTME